MVRQALAACLLGMLVAVPAVAQNQDTVAAPPAAPQSPPAARLDESKLPDVCRANAQHFENNRAEYTGDVLCLLPDNARVSGDVINVFQEDNGSRIVAEGNVVFSGPDGHISAERLEYLTATGTGTFEVAHGFLTLPHADPRQFAGQTPEVEFSGQRLRKLGPRRFEVTQGIWTTCLQPTPRWDFTTGSMVLELDHYVIATNTVLRVKGVPLFWLPILYYPIQDDNRATGFLMPTYGTSTFRGQTLSNAFFWAINRSQDATFTHDWFTRAGQGVGAEYRYVVSPQSSGTVRFNRFARNATTFTENGATATLPGANSYELTGNAVQTFAPGIVGRLRLDYFSDVINQQLLHQTLYEASRHNRLIEGGLTASHGPWSANALYQRNEIIVPETSGSTASINGIDNTVVYGSAPRVNVTLAPQRLFASPIYASLNSDLSYLPYQHFVGGVLTQDNSFGRFDLAPSVRVPFSKLTFLSVNTSASYRTTYYSRRASSTAGETTDGSFVRQYATVRTEVVGPVLTRIFDLKEGGFAERLKHVIEPAVSIDLTSPIHDFRETPLQSDVSDFVVGGTSRITYGVTSRLFFRKPTINKVRGETREFLTVGLQQTSYSNAEASRYDSTYSTTVASSVGRTLSPVALTARVSPSGTFDGNLRAEYDVSNGLGLQSITSGTSINYPTGGVTLNYSRQRFDATQPANSFLSASTHAQTAQNKVNGTYSISWDIARGYVVSQGVVASYMAQCCGVQAEFQQFNFPSVLGLPINADRRINFAFVLAGLGTFSNFFGAFGGR